MSRFKSPALARNSMFYFLFCCCFSIFCPKTHYLFRLKKILSHFSSFTIFNTLQIIWPIIRVSRYRTNIFKCIVISLSNTIVKCQLLNSLIFKYVEIHNSRCCYGDISFDMLLRNNTIIRVKTIKKTTRNAQTYSNAVSTRNVTLCSV